MEVDLKKIITDADIKIMTFCIISIKLYWLSFVFCNQQCALVLVGKKWAIKNSDLTKWGKFSLFRVFLFPRFQLKTEQQSELLPMALPVGYIMICSYWTFSSWVRGILADPMRVIIGGRAGCCLLDNERPAVYCGLLFFHLSAVQS